MFQVSNIQEKLSSGGFSELVETADIATSEDSNEACLHLSRTTSQQATALDFFAFFFEPSFSLPWFVLYFRTTIDTSAK